MNFRKRVRTDREQIEGPVMHEEVSVERVPMNGEATEAQIGEDEVSVPVTEERNASQHDPRSRSRYDSLLPGSLLPTGYALDPSDPDVLLLLRPDGTTAAVFSSWGVTAEGVLEAAGKDRGRRSASGIRRRTVKTARRPQP